MSARSARNAVNISDLRGLAGKRLPRVVFDYLDGGADDEVTLRRNCEAFGAIGFRPRHAVDVSKVNLRTTVLGFELSFPAILAPVGYSRLMHREGELAKTGRLTFFRPSPGTGWKM
jgi:isopentenyl diphosphate isomerase/L-lactate dehydrogenase-like FMN-dependent dehydrogenase